MSDKEAPNSRWRTRCAIALLVVGLVVAFMPALAAGKRSVRLVEAYSSVDSLPTRTCWIELPAPGSLSCPPGIDICGTSAMALVRSDFAWAAVAISLAVVPLLFGWSRLAGVGFGRFAGLACAVVASTSALTLVASMRGPSDLPDGVWWTVPMGGVLMAAAFLVAPPPRVRDE